jgi:cold shock CspA family protein
MSAAQETVSVRMIGQVKWFNNKAGYGFITVSDGDNAGKDIFIHYSTIRVTNSQYKYLVQGEYVEFTLVKPESGPHEFQATDVSGIKGGALMCETRKVNRPAEDSSAPRTRTSFRRPSGPNDNAGRRPEGAGEYTTVSSSRRRPSNRRPPARQTDARPSSPVDAPPL